MGHPTIAGNSFTLPFPLKGECHVVLWPFAPALTARDLFPTTVLKPLLLHKQPPLGPSQPSLHFCPDIAPTALCLFKK